MLNKIILASKSKVRKEILDKNNITSQVEPSNVDEDVVKESLLKEQASPSVISKNLAELKANKVSLKFINQMVLGADSVIDLDGELISKPQDREEAFDILKKFKLDNKKVAIEHNGRIITKINYKKKYLKSNDKLEVVHFIGGG